jgi:hypothetical protein
MRDWLWKKDFAAFVNTAHAAPAYDAVASSFQDIFERTKGVGVNVAMAIVVTLFFRGANAAYTHAEELRWAVYLFGCDYSMLQVVDVSRETLGDEACERETTHAMARRSPDDLVDAQGWGTD